MAARLAIGRAQRQLAEDAGVHLHTRNFQVINTVGAVSLKATLNCEAFADAHRASAHYDQSSFVGLAWRPENEACCVGTLAHTCTLVPLLILAYSPFW
jgi:TATA-box binding protein (TBP) (component of TFIID and TFIIIB)